MEFGRWTVDEQSSYPWEEDLAHFRGALTLEWALAQMAALSTCTTHVLPVPPLPPPNMFSTHMLQFHSLCGTSCSGVQEVGVRVQSWAGPEQWPQG